MFHEHEIKTITSFIIKEKQERYRFLLGNSGRRGEGLNRLNHCRDLNPTYTTWLPRKVVISTLLCQERSPRMVYVISGADAIDGTMIALDEVEYEVIQGGWGTIVSCIPGQLAYYYDEQGERQALLKRLSRT
jgi:hypothetical protein